MFYTGARVPGEQALAWGLADALAGAETLRSDAETLAEDIAKSAPLAVVSVRATLRTGLADEIARATERELREQQWLRETDDAQEGIRSVAERRDGVFTGT